MLVRKKTRKKMKSYIIYPEEQWRQKWELFITLLLLYTCCATPYVLAFASSESEINSVWDVMDSEFFVDIFFLVDIILNFFFAYYNSEYELIEDRKKIAYHYLGGWFIVDFLAVLPFDKLF
jgi:hypothetical protein